MRRDSGLYRLHTQGYVIPAYFNWDEGSIGPYSVQSEFKYSEDFHTTVAEPNKHWLYKMMHDDDDVVACFFVNANYVCCLRKDGSYYYHDIYVKLVYNPSNRWGGVTEEVYPVGYVKTRYKCQSVSLAPAKVLYSPTRCAINATGVWVPVLDDIEIGPELPIRLYSELIHSDYEYMYVKKGGEAVWKSS